MKTYRALRAAYIEKPSIRNAAKVAGVCFETAKKYIMDGRSEKNMPAIIDLASAESQKEKAELELDLRSFRRKYQKEIAEALGGSMAQIRLHNERTRRLVEQAQNEKAKGDKGEIVDPSSKFFEEIKSYDMLIRLMERAMGQPDETIGVEDGDFVSKMTAKECVDYLKNNVVPEHLR
jgi:hypothetical protein